MFSPSRNTQRQQLERTILSTTYANLLGEMQQAEPALAGFRDWLAVVDQMRGLGADDPRKDALLATLLNRHRHGSDDRVQTILLLVFWPAAEWVLQQKWTYNRDRDELWSDVLASLAEVISRVDPQLRPAGIARKIVNDTLHRLGDTYRLQWAREKHEILEVDLDLMRETSEASGDRRQRPDLWVDQDPAFGEINRRRGEGQQLQWLKAQLKRGRIKESDFFFLVGVWVYQQPIGKVAEGLCIKREAGKKRLQRLTRRLGLGASKSAID